jgi:signal transduction histidine kinase
VPGGTGSGGGHRWRRPRFTLRLRLALLFGGFLAVVALTLLGTAAVVLDRTVRAAPQFPAGQTLVLRDASGRLLAVDAGDLSRALRAQARSDLLRSGSMAFGVVVLAGLAGGWVLAGRALQPVSEVTATARRLSTETLHERIALAGPEDEIKELADTFDAMLARLDAAFDSQRRFVANASHELRTPLAVIRTEVDVTLADPGATMSDLRTMGEVVRDASVRADRLVDALLVLARSEAQARVGLEVQEPVDLADAVRRAVDAVGGEARARCLAVTAQTAPAPTRGDPELLDRLVGNLVENAVRHNVDGGWVAVGTGTEAGRAALSVRNSGPVVDPGAVDELFEPFRRGGLARTGSRGAGLGLSIVRAVTAAHAGEVAVRAPDAGGLEVTVWLSSGSVGARSGAAG